MVKALGPGVVGVPLMTPLPGVSVSPAGREPPVTLQVVVPVPPVAVRVVESATPCTALGSGLVLVIDRASYNFV